MDKFGYAQLYVRHEGRKVQIKKVGTHEIVMELTVSAAEELAIDLQRESNEASKLKCPFTS